MRVPQSTAEFEALLDFLRRSRGFDFTGYKRSSLIRRVDNRMQLINVKSYGEYLDYLEVHPEEFAPLFNTVLINVTAFFRDPPAWETLMTDVLPAYLAQRAAPETIRVWSAGCASGEEAYTLAIVLAELLGIGTFQQRVKIYATDLDEESLNAARHAMYSERAVAAVPEPLQAKYFERGDNGNFAFRKDLRRQVIFGRHDLMQDAPISRIDLLACRNTLMYFNAEAQARVLARFHFALSDGGLLFLGRAETLLSQSREFSPLDLKRRIVMKAGPSRGTARPANGSPEYSPEMFESSDATARSREAAFEASPLAQIVTDAVGILSSANERARQLFGLSVSDVGRPLRDMKLSYKPADLRSCIEQSQTERRSVTLKDVEWLAAPNEHRWLDIVTSPLFNAGGVTLGAAISFVDVTSPKRLQRELEHSNEELETAYQELQSTNEELETTNEELQSTVEELETTNEELQSTNEELETMNEELQSTNEELQTINEELRTRSDELNQVNSFLQAILVSLRGAVVVVDRDFVVLVWNNRAEDLWGLRKEEAEGKHFFSLDIGLSVEQLKRPLRACMSGETDHAELTVEATNRRGKPITCRISCVPLLGGGQPQGVIVVMEQAHAGDGDRPTKLSRAGERSRS